MTKSTRIAVVLVIALAATAALAQSDAQKSFAQLKALTGSWEGNGPKGTALRVSWRETAGGSAIVSEILGTGPENMISMFHMDGSRLLMTHYCGAGNQPRMQASVSPDGKTITFTFVDGTNIAPGAGHMQKMVLTMLDDNHHTEDWTFLDHGKEMKELFDLRRQM